MNIKRTAVAPLTVLILCSAGIAEGKSPHSSTQLHFSAEDARVEKPVPIPESVLAVLRTDEMVRVALANENISAEKIPLSWFSASAIHLSSSERAGLVVMAEGPLHGSNVTTFWVFCATARGYKLVLTGLAHDLTVKNTRWKEHRDIVLASMTAAQISTVSFRFEGERYAEYKTKSGLIH
jgi:hypothetical protein